MEAVSVVVVGFGDRAVAYTKYALAHPDRLKVRAVIDPNPFRRALAKEMFSLSDDVLYADMSECLKLGKIADDDGLARLNFGTLYMSKPKK